jgi:hypothetical protein
MVVDSPLGGHTDHRIRRNQDGFFAALEQHASGTAGADGVARLQEIFLLQRRLMHASAGEPNLARGFADDPVVAVGGEGGRGRRQDERCREHA